MACLIKWGTIVRKFVAILICTCSLLAFNQASGVEKSDYALVFENIVEFEKLVNQDSEPTRKDYENLFGTKISFEHDCIAYYSKKLGKPRSELRSDNISYFFRYLRSPDGPFGAKSKGKVKIKIYLKTEDILLVENICYDRPFVLINALVELSDDTYIPVSFSTAPESDLTYEMGCIEYMFIQGKSITEMVRPMK